MSNLIAVAVIAFLVVGWVYVLWWWDESTDGPTGPHPFGNGPIDTYADAPYCSWCGRHYSHRVHMTGRWAERPEYQNWVDRRHTDGDW